MCSSELPAIARAVVDQLIDTRSLWPIRASTILDVGCIAIGVVSGANGHCNANVDFSAS